MCKGAKAVDQRRILGDTWYANMFDDLCVPFDQLLKEKYPSWIAHLANRNGLLRGLLLFWLGRSFSFVMTTYGYRGAQVAIVLESLFHRRSRRMLLLQFIRAKTATSWHRQFLRSVLWKFVLKPAIRRSMVASQVLTNWERAHYAQMLDVDVNRMFYIPYPLRNKNDELAVKLRTGELTVLSSGRAACDWETLFKAAEEASWHLTVICGKRDLHRVQKLNQRQRVHVMSEIPFEEHERAMRDAAVYVLCLRDQEISSGHIRIKDAIRAGTPVVASKVRGLEGYIVNGETGLLVEPGNPVALRAAIERLLASPELCLQLTKNAFVRASEQTTEQYLAQIRMLIEECADGLEYHG